LSSEKLPDIAIFQQLLISSLLQSRVAYRGNLCTIVVKSNITNHLTHKPGVVCEVDWSGPTMKIIDTATNDTITVYLFVATLPYSQYSYVEPCFDMKENTWLKCNVNMFEFFGGSTIRTVCDNLKTGVISHPREGDIILNAHYESFGNHYCTAIMPAPVRRPKRKASVEGTVGKIATAIIAKLRNERFYSMERLKISVGKALSNFNEAPFQKREGSRSEVFREVESDCLRKLPLAAYEIADWIYGRSVNIDCHIVYDKNRYSCPYQHVGKKVDLKITDTLLEIYLNGERIATHHKLADYVQYDWSTHEEDMPDKFQHPEWDDKRIKNWAYSIGNHTGEVIDRIFESVSIKEQGYNSCLSVLRLSKSYSPVRLETACEMALAKIRIPRYKHLKSILAANQDNVVLKGKSNAKPRSNTETSRGYIRGSGYYGGGNGDDE
jgi:hypothetical protein